MTYHLIPDAESPKTWIEIPIRIPELCVWFDQLAIRSPRGADIPIDSFVASGKRWWDAFYAGDERTRGFGMAPLGGPTNGVGGNGLNS